MSRLQPQLFRYVGLLTLGYYHLIMPTSERGGEREREQMHVAVVWLLTMALSLPSYYYADIRVLCRQRERDQTNMCRCRCHHNIMPTEREREIKHVSLYSAIIRERERDRANAVLTASAKRTISNLIPFVLEVYSASEMYWLAKSKTAPRLQSCRSEGWELCCVV